MGGLEERALSSSWVIAPDLLHIQSSRKQLKDMTLGDLSLGQSVQIRGGGGAGGGGGGVERRSWEWSGACHIALK